MIIIIEDIYDDIMGQMGPSISIEFKLHLNQLHLDQFKFRQQKL